LPCRTFYAFRVIPYFQYQNKIVAFLIIYNFVIPFYKKAHQVGELFAYISFNSKSSSFFEYFDAIDYCRYGWQTCRQSRAASWIGCFDAFFGAATATRTGRRPPLSPPPSIRSPSVCGTVRTMSLVSTQPEILVIRNPTPSDGSLPTVAMSPFSQAYHLVSLSRKDISHAVHQVKFFSSALIFSYSAGPDVGQTINPIRILGFLPHFLALGPANYTTTSPAGRTVPVSITTIRKSLAFFPSGTYNRPRRGI
jgi:hypothetical protein